MTNESYVQLMILMIFCNKLMPSFSILWSSFNCCLLIELGTFVVKSRVRDSKLFTPKCVCVKCYAASVLFI